MLWLRAHALYGSLGQKLSELSHVAAVQTHILALRRL